MASLLTQEEILALSDADKKEWRDKVLEQLKWLNVQPKSDWHKGFEAYLKADAHEAEGGTAEVIVEHPLGEAPPRIDFIVWLHEEETRLNKEIYRIFRRFNVIEYKNPHDRLNWRVIHKAIGYANLYVGLAESEGDRPKDQITISIFRAVKNPELFKELERAGHLVPGRIKGIYQIVGLTEFPFQIVIMTELEGKEYAAARAMIDEDRASLEDIKQFMDVIAEEEDETVKGHMRVILDLIGEKNPAKIEELLRRDKNMSPKWMEIMKPEIEKRDVERDKKNLFSYVQAGGMTLEFAASQAHQPVAEFALEMTQSGYKVPTQPAASAQ